MHSRSTGNSHRLWWSAQQWWAWTGPGGGCGPWLGTVQQRLVGHQWKQAVQ